MTTERVLPAIASPATRDARATTTQAVAAAPVPRPIAARRSQPFLTVSARAGILLGTSAALYAVSLTAVATLQASDDRAIAASRQPYLDSIAEAQARNDALETSLSQVDAGSRAVADAINATTLDLAAYEARLDALSALVTRVEGSTTALPTRIRLPSVSIHGAVVGGARPRTTTTTRASGG